MMGIQEEGAVFEALRFALLCASCHGLELKRYLLRWMKSMEFVGTQKDVHVTENLRG